MNEQVVLGDVVAGAPLVSVVIPVFNRVQYLDESIKSVLAQTYSNWELILVDDGSSDGSFEKELDWAKRFPDRIRCVTHEGRTNRGISATRNRGTEAARGSYIACLDSDDMWVADRLEKQMLILQHYPQVGMILGATFYWHPDAPQSDRVLFAGGPRDVLVHPPQLFHDMYPLGEGTAPSMNTVLLRRDIVERIGGWEESFRTTYEDQAMLVKVYLLATVFISSNQGDIYRQHAATIMRTELEGHRYFHNRYAFLAWLKAWLAKEHPDRQAERELVDARLREIKLLVCRNPVGHFLWRAVRKCFRLLREIRRH